MDVVRHTMLRTFDRIFFGEDAGDQKKGSVVTGLAQVGESVESSLQGATKGTFIHKPSSM